VLGDPVNRVDPQGLLFGDLLDALLAPVPMWPLLGPCPLGSGDSSGEGAVRDALGNLIDNQVDNAVEDIVGGGGKVVAAGKITGGGRFIGPIGTAVDASTVAAEGFLVVYGATREQRDLADTILTGSTDARDYAPRRYYPPTGNGPSPCPSGGGGC